MQQYVIHAWDYTDEQALERRMAARPAHLEGVRLMKGKNQFVMGGAMLNEQGQMIGSTMVLQFETHQEFQAWYDQEPYIQQKVWERINYYPFRVAVV